MSCKGIIFGDLHARESAPSCRKDDYFEAFFNKLNFVDNVIIDRNVNFVVLPGDVFHTHRSSDRLKSILLRLFKMWRNNNIEIFAVAGQHDLRFHSLDYSNTPLSVLEAADILRVLIPNTYVSLYDGSVHVYGVSYGEEILQPVVYDDAKNFLVLHKMVIKNKTLWPGQKDYSIAKRLLKKYDYDMVFCGDNHETFIEEYNDKLLINCGSFMRMRIDQKDHQPVVCYVDVDSGSYELIDIPIQSSFDVMDLSIVEEENEISADLVDFVSALSNKGYRGDSVDNSLDFTSRLFDYVDGCDDVTDGVISVVKECLPN